MKDKIRSRIEALRPLLKDSVAGVQIAAAQAIERLEGLNSTGEILAVLKNGDMGARIGAIYALGEIGGDKVLSPLIYCAGRPEVDIRSAAVDVLGRLALPAALPVLIERLEDIHTAVQARAITAIGNFRVGPDVLQRLRTFLDASNGSLEAEAALSLARLKDVVSVDRIILLLGSEHASTRQAAATALYLMPL
ncbi:MAG TPA: HEAT repeat domain-containing protein [Desulfuromonadales bacterium]|nr:HEAT repeat domain-containing protein [Desulfuromonadales bacterium]